MSRPNVDRGGNKGGGRGFKGVCTFSSPPSRQRRQLSMVKYVTLVEAASFFPRVAGFIGFSLRCLESFFLD